MKFVCGACDRLADVSGFRMEGDGLMLRCARCRGESRVNVVPALEQPTQAVAASDAVAAFSRRDPAPGSPNVLPFRAPPSEVARFTAEAARADPFAVPKDRCPKCISPKSPVSPGVCAQCGLDFGQASPAGVMPDPELAQRWTELLAQWSDSQLHDALLSLAAARGELPAVGRLYRIRLAQSPGDPFASRGRDEVIRLASLSSLGPRHSGVHAVIPARWQYALGAGMVTAFLLIAYLLWSSVR